MFHTYITTSCGNKVDIDRASYLANVSLWNQCFSDAADKIGEPCKLGSYTQRFWNRYCELHYERYGEPFLPDVKPDWDR